jgi:hypothetical protein
VPCYSDFNMVPPDGQPAAGVCHASGANARLPPQWLLYVTVEDLEGEQRFAVIRDPAGAHMGLIGPKA